MKVLIVILNYNGYQLLKKHIGTVVKSSYKSFDIVVVDNGSSDSSVKFLQEKYPSVRIVKSKSNLGFGRGNNLGVQKYPNYDAYLFLNNDISVEPDWLTNMVQVLSKDSGIGAIGPRILYSKKDNGRYVVNSAGLHIDNHYFGYDRYDGEFDSEKFNVIEEVDGLTGGALLVRREVWEKVGGFDDRMFMYYEDVDLSLRIRDLSYTLYYCGNSVVYHDHMGSSRGLGSFRRNFMSMRNRYISIVSRRGFLIGLTETIWYLYKWFLWKLLYSKRITLKEFFTKNI